MSDEAWPPRKKEPEKAPWTFHDIILLATGLLIWGCVFKIFEGG